MLSPWLWRAMHRPVFLVFRINIGGAARLRSRHKRAARRGLALSIPIHAAIAARVARRVNRLDRG